MQNQEIIQFVPGKTYFCRSVCDYNCVWQFKVVKRTAQTVRLQEVGTPRFKTCRVKVWNGVETVLPLGSYSMAPVLGADKGVM